jgi:hypothetical protein
VAPADTDPKALVLQAGSDRWESAVAAAAAAEGISAEAMAALVVAAARVIMVVVEAAEAAAVLRITTARAAVVVAGRPTPSRVPRTYICGKGGKTLNATVLSSLAGNGKNENLYALLSRA